MKISLRKNVFSIIHRQWEKTKPFVLHHAPQAQGTRDLQKRIQKNFRFSPYAKREK